MYAIAGMKLEEWENGQVKIGLAVCPQNHTAVGIEQGNGSILLNSNHEIVPTTLPDFIIPKSALIIRPPKKYQRSQGGFSVTYAHQVNGPSDFVIMLNSQDQDQGSLHDKIVSRLEQEKHHLSQETPTITDMSNSSGNEEEGQEEEVSLSQIRDEDDHRTEAAGLSATEEVEQEEVANTSQTSQEEEEDNSHTSEEESSNHRTPQDTKHTSEDSGEEIIEHETGGIVEVIVTSPRKEKTRGSPKGEASQSRKSGDTSTMKRVSWVEECEEKIFGEDEEDLNPTRNNSHNSKENKRESGRKFNGFEGSGTSSHRRSSSTRKHRHHHHQQQQHGFNSGEESPTTIEGYTGSVGAAPGKRSGDKSRIPTISSGGGEYPGSCEFYRRKMLREYEHCYNNNNSSHSPPTLADNWYGYTSLQRYAGQKVVKKITEEQKRLEEDISNRRKTEIWILGSDPGEDFLMMSPNVPLRKKTTRLKPMHLVQ